MEDAPDNYEQVQCPACGVALRRRDAREYDRYGNRWERTGKTFEYLCKPCYREVCHLPRGNLEDTLGNVGHHSDPAAFIGAYYAHVEMRESQSR